MCVRQIITPDRPDNGPAEAHSKACLEVDASPMQSEIGHHELRETNLREDAVADLLVMMDPVDADRIEAALKNGALNAISVRGIEARIERHRNEAAT